eukprot:s2191_g11.t2
MALWNSNPYLLIQDSRAKKGPGDRSDDLSPRGFRLTRSEEIGRNHGLGESVQTLLPRLYCDPLKRLGTSIKLNYQPFMKDLPELMEFHKQRKPQFDEKVAVAKKTNGKNLMRGHIDNILTSLEQRDHPDERRGQMQIQSCLQIHGCNRNILASLYGYRATILYDDIHSMYDGLEVLEQIRRRNWRLWSLTIDTKLCRDLQLSVKIDSVCELQLTKIMAFVKFLEGTRWSSKFRSISRADRGRERFRRRCDEILLPGHDLATICRIS